MKALFKTCGQDEGKLTKQSAGPGRGFWKLGTNAGPKTGAAACRREGHRRAELPRSTDPAGGSPRVTRPPPGLPRLLVPPSPGAQGAQGVRAGVQGRQTQAAPRSGCLFFITRQCSSEPTRINCKNSSIV